MRRLSLLLAFGAAVAVPALVSAHPLPGAPGCEIFPPNNPWNQRVDRLPVAQNSARLIASVGLDDPVHPDFGTGLYDGAPNGIPFTVVSNQTAASESASSTRTSRTRVGTRSRRTRRSRAARARRGDRHVILVDRRRAPTTSCTPRSTRAAARTGRPARARSSTSLQPRATRRVDVGRRRGAADPSRTGPPRRGRAPGRSTTRCDSRRRAPRRAYVYPARHEACDRSGCYPPMGLRVRLKASVDISRLPPPGADRRAGAQDLRDDPRRQRLGLVYLRGAEPEVERRRAARARRDRR